MRTNGKKHIVFWLFLLLLPVGLWGQEVKPLPMPSSPEGAVEFAHPVIEPEKDSDTVVRPGDRTSISAGEMPVSPAVPGDSFQTEPPKTAGGLDAPVEYVAKDSIVLLGTGIAFLHGEADVKYQQLQLTSE